MDLTDTIVPRSDQLNSDDLFTSPRTVTITDVRAGNTEQPVDIHLAEYPGRPFKPSKTVRRILVAAWGKDGDAYVGRRLTLYRDPDVRFGGQDVGGIRVSHMSHIDKPMKLALTVSKGKKAPHIVQPLKEDAPPPPTARGQAGIPDALMRALHASLRDAKLSDRDAGLAYIGDILDREITSTKELSRADASFVIDTLKREAEAPPPEPTLPEPPLDEGGGQ